MRSAYVEALKSFLEKGAVQEKLEPDYLISELREKGVINQTEADDIMAKNSRLVRQRELMLDIISRRDDEAFDTLLEIMESEHYKWARDILQSIVAKSVKKEQKIIDQ